MFPYLRRHQTGRVIALVLLGTPSLSGCGGTNADPKALPPEYRTLAENLAPEIKPSRDQFRDNKSITEVIAEGHAAVMALRGIRSSDPDITYIADQG